MQRPIKISSSFKPEYYSNSSNITDTPILILIVHNAKSSEISSNLPYCQSMFNIEYLEIYKEYKGVSKMIIIYRNHQNI